MGRLYPSVSAATLFRLGARMFQLVMLKRLCWRKFVTVWNSTEISTRLSRRLSNISLCKKHTEVVK